MKVLQIALVAALSLSACAQEKAPAAKLPADQQAYNTAKAISDPDRKVAALKQFLHDFPTSSRVDAANHAIFTALCAHNPPNEKEIRDQARLLISSTKDDAARWNEENSVASALANVGPNGTDLPDAEKWAKDMVKHQDEPTFNKDRLAMYAKYKEPAPTPEKLHKDFAHNHANLLQTLADVLFHEGKQAETAAVLTEAYALNPQDAGVLELRGRLALQQNRDADALEALQQAELYGGLKPEVETQFLALYRKAHGGSDAGYVADMDARYAAAFPPSFTPAHHAPVAGGHTAILELFTGSGCPPCVGMDLAVESVLDAYPGQVTLLAYDLHIPRPDPLTTPATVDRGKFYDIKFTPTYLIDGHQFEPVGGTREDAERLYKPVARNLNAQLARPSSVQLQLTAAPGADGTIKAHAAVTLGPLDELKQQVALEPVVVPDPDAKPKPASKPDAKPETKPAPAEPKFVLNFALVEDDIRYTGENGVRFHRMVVRALARPAATGFALTPGASATLDASFDLVSISNALTDYLDTYEQHNERFGAIKFRSKNTTMNPAHLSIAVWVQDTASQRILQSAIVPVAKP